MEKKKALVLCSGRESSTDLLLLLPLLRSLQDLEYEVEYFAPQGFTLDPKLHRITLQPAVKYPGIAWLYNTFVFPLVIVQYCLARKYTAIISTQAYLVFVSWFASALFVSKRVLIMQGVAQQPRGKFSKLFYGFCDFLGLLASSTIVVPNVKAKSEIASLSSILEEKVVELPVSYSNFLTDELLNDVEYEFERRRLLLRYDLGERTSIFIADIDHCSFDSVEYCLRLFASANSERQALFLLGTNLDQNSLMAIAVGLGLVERVFFIEAIEEQNLVSPLADFCLVLEEYDYSNYAINLARAHNAVLIPCGLEHSDCFASQYVLERDVSRDTSRLAKLLNSKAEIAQIREKQEKSASWKTENWGVAACKYLGL